MLTARTARFDLEICRAARPGIPVEPANRFARRSRTVHETRRPTLQGWRNGSDLARTAAVSVIMPSLAMRPSTQSRRARARPALSARSMR